jgi:formate hydrogenlyase transcriptional activator
MEDALLSCEPYRALLEVSEAISRHGDLNELFHELAVRLRSVVPFDFLLLLLYDADADKMRLHILESAQPERVVAGPTLTPLQSPGGLVWQSQQPLSIDDFAQETRFPELGPVWERFGMRCGCYLPLTTAQGRLGTICFSAARPHAYRSEDLRLLGEVARLVAVAVANALNFEKAACLHRKLSEERDRLRLLLEVNNAVVSRLELRELFRAITATLGRVVRHDYASLAVVDEARRIWRLHALDFPGGSGRLREDREVPYANAPASAAFETGKAQRYDEAGLRRLDSEVSNTLLAEGLRCFCSVPLVARGRVFASLNVGRLQNDGFSDAEVELLTQAAAQLALAVDNAFAYRRITELNDRLAEEKLYLEGEIRSEYKFAEIVGASAAIKAALRQVEVVAPADTTVLIQGETGTGKELIARAIHNLSRRRERVFVKLNCAAIPTGLLESELFGHEKGAFTGAVARKVGRFELAHGGTLFLDEIGDIAPELQPKLLRVLQEQEFERLGGTKTIKVDVRLVAATNRDLGRMAAAKEFRADLYYRLNVFPIPLPPLRERREDIPQLVRYFVRENARRLGRTIETIPSEAMAALTRYSWPGNVRELENVIERSVLLSSGSTLRVPIGELKAATEPTADGSATLAEAEREHILSVLRQTRWVIGGPAGAAARLGMKRTTLQSKMQKLGIERPPISGDGSAPG